MNTMRNQTILLLSLLMLLAGTAQAAFDDVPVSPRARAMGAATVAVDGDAWSFYNNPSQLPWLPRASVAASTAQPNNGDFNRLTTIGGSFLLPDKWGGMSFGLRHYGVEYQSVDLLSEYTVSVSHGFQLYRDESSAASLGWTINFYNLELAQSVGLSGDGSDGIDPGNAWAVGIDLAGSVEVWKRTKVGFLIHNLNDPRIGVDDEELRQQVRIGMAYVPYDNVITAFDIESRPGEEFRLHAGVEFGVLEILDLRVGLETDPNKVTGGFGFEVRGILLDYGFSTGGGVLESTHQFALGYRFGGGEE